MTPRLPAIQSPSKEYKYGSAGSQLTELTYSAVDFCTRRLPHRVSILVVLPPSVRCGGHSLFVEAVYNSLPGVDATRDIS